MGCDSCWNFDSLQGILKRNYLSDLGFRLQTAFSGPRCIYLRYAETLRVRAVEPYHRMGGSDQTSHTKAFQPAGDFLRSARRLRARAAYFHHFILVEKIREKTWLVFAWHNDGTGRRGERAAD